MARYAASFTRGNIKNRLRGGGTLGKLSQNSGNSRKSGTVREDTSHGAFTPLFGKGLCYSGWLQVPTLREMARVRVQKKEACHDLNICRNSETISLWVPRVGTKPVPAVPTDALGKEPRGIDT